MSAPQMPCLMKHMPTPLAASLLRPDIPARRLMLRLWRRDSMVFFYFTQQRRYFLGESGLSSS
jgi:hypothetical protein